MKTFKTMSNTKITSAPNRATKDTKDKNGISYDSGNHALRRKMAAQKPLTSNLRTPIKRTKLPRKYWVKGKSKFLETRLQEEFGKDWKFRSINDLKI